MLDHPLEAEARADSARSLAQAPRRDMGTSMVNQVTMLFRMLVNLNQPWLLAIHSGHNSEQRAMAKIQQHALFSDAFGRLVCLCAWL